MRNKINTNLYFKIKNYSNFVIYAKRICLILTFSLVISLIFNPLINPSYKQVDLTLRNFDAQKAENDLLKIENPDFLSVSSKYGTYHIKAQKIIQNTDQAILTNLTSYFENQTKIPIKISAQNGISYGEHKNFKLMNDIVFSYGDIRLFTNIIFVDIPKLSLFTEDEIKIIYNNSYLYSKNGIVSDIETKIFKFKGEISAKYILEKDNSVVYLNCDELEINDIKKTANFFENIDLSYQNIKLNADKLIYDYNEKSNEGNKIYIFNNILLFTEAETIKGNYGVVDLNKQNLVLYNGVTINRNNNIIKGDQFIFSFKDKKGKLHSQNTNRVTANIILKQ